jgi:hypothetical protein
LEYNLNYSTQVILSILSIAIIVMFFIRKRKVGVILVIASWSKLRFFYLLGVLLFLYLGFQGVYNAFHYQGFMSSLSIYILITDLSITVLYLIALLTSKIHIGLKGVSVPGFPFFLPRNQIRGYEVLSKSLVLKRNGKSDFEIAIRVNDANKVESALRQMLNTYD